MIALGLGGPIGPALLIATMVVAAITVHAANGFFAPTGYELNAVYTAAAVALALTGFGALAVDAAIGSAVWTPAIDWIVVGVGALAGLLNVAARRKPAAAEATQA